MATLGDKAIAEEVEALEKKSNESREEANGFATAL